SSSTATAPTQTSGPIHSVFQPVVHHEQAGGEAEGLEEVLRLPHAGERISIHAGALLSAEPRQCQVHHRLADPDGPAARLDEDVFHDAEAATVAQLLDPPDQVA